MGELVTGEIYKSRPSTSDLTNIIFPAIYLTGQQLTVALNSPLITAWSNVDPGVTNTWTEVNTSDTAVWVEVDLAA